MRILLGYPDNYFDLAIVDPPYGLPKGSTHGRGKLKSRIINTGDMSWDIAPDENYFKELFRISKNQIIWGGNYFNLPPTRCFVVWNKMQPWENFSQVEYAWTSFDHPAKYFEFDNRYGNKIHPTQKPVKLYKFLLKQFAKPEFKIIDTHLGSASSAIACYDFNVSEFIGCEADKLMFDKAMERYKVHTSQLKIF